MVVEKEEEGEEKVVSVIRDGSKKKNSKEKGKKERKETETEEKNYSFNTLTETDHAPLQM